MNHRRIYATALVLMLSLLLSLSNLGARPVYATYGSVEVTKKDTSGTVLSGWTFKLYKKESSGSYTYVTSKVTGTNGKATFSQIPYAYYKICEVIQTGWTPQSPSDSSGCQLTQVSSSSSLKYLTYVNQPPTRSIKVIKTNQNGTKLSGWEFKARNKTTNVYYGPVTTNSYGEATISGLPYGDYAVCETLKSGWTAIDPSSGCRDITINSSTPTSSAQTGDGATTQTGGGGTGLTTLTFKNQETPTRELKVYKKDPAGNILGGWEFKIKKYGTTTILSTKTTTTGQPVTFTGLTVGQQYTVCETKQSGWTTQSPTDSNGCQNITIASSGEMVLTFVNTPPTRSIKVIKKDPAGTRLSGWEFKARNKSTNVYYGPVTTNSNGEATLSGLPYGDYEVCETAKSGWVAVDPSDRCHDITINSSTPTGSAQTGEGATTQTYGTGLTTLYYVNKQVRDLTVYKKDLTGNILGGWEFKLRKYGSTTILATKTTSAGQPVTFTGLDVGTKYSICETKQTGWTVQSPTDSNGCQTITIAGSGEMVLTFVNKPPTRNIKIIKTNESGTRLSGWVFSARNTSTNQTYGPVTTNSNGEATISDLPFGTYEVCETLQSGWAALSPSTTAGCQTITLNSSTTTSSVQTSDGATTQTYTTTTNVLTFKNQRQVRSIKVVKKNNSNVGLPNWQIQATNTSTNQVYGPVTTDANGVATISNLPFGTYNVCEILQSGWTYVSPANGCYSVTINSSTPTAAAQTGDGATTQTYGTGLSTYTFTNRPLVPGIDIKKLTNDKDANEAIGDSSVLPRIAPGATVTWKYEVSNTGEVAFEKAKVVVTDDQTGVTPVYNSVLSGDADTMLEPGEKWLYIATGTAKTLTYPMSGTITVLGCKTSDNLPRAVYENKGTVTVTNGPTDYDYSHYCNPEDPKINIIKYTNNKDANDPNGSESDLPRIASGGAVTWKYVVENTGNVPFAKANVVVTDDQTGVTPVYSSVLVGDSDEILEPGEKWIYLATGTAKTLAFNMSGTTTVEGCKTSDNLPRPVYKNKGTVTVTNGPTDFDYSHYCNTPDPKIDIIKYTNNADANSATGADVPKITSGGVVTWKYVVENTGNVPFAKANVVVTDDQTGVSPVYSSVLVGDSDEILEPGEKWIYLATGTALNLTFDLNTVTIVSGCKTSDLVPRPVYKNKGTVTITNGPTDYDYSHYCNPEVPNIAIKKYTNNADANDANGNDVPRIAPGATVTWKYEVTNTGNVPFKKDKVAVTDNRGVTPVYSSGDTGNDNILSPGEVWIYTATGPALTLVAGPAYIVNGCAENNIPRPTYNNTGTVKILPNNTPTASDPSHYCNPAGPNIDIKKYTNGADADTATGNDVPKLQSGATVTWTYVVSNTGNVSFLRSNVEVTDDQTGVTPAFVSELFGNNDANFDPGERLLFRAVGVAQNLKFDLQNVTIVNGCLTGQGQQRPVYENKGTVKVKPSNVPTDFDYSHYCNPENPGIDIKKYTNGADADSPTGNDVPKIAPNGGIEWTYVVSNTGNVPFTKASVVVTDNRGVAVSYDKVLVGDGDEVLEPGEIWQYKATGNALTLSFSGGPAYVVNGCQTGQGINRPTYNNVGTVSVTGTALTDNDPSHYCNPENPGIEIKKYTNGADADDANGNDVPKIAPNGGIEWTYVVSNTGNVPFNKASVVVTDNRGVAVSYEKVLVGDGDEVLEPGEIWQYKATGNALTLTANGAAYIVEGCKTAQDLTRPTYNNVGTVSVTGTALTDNDPSHYCNPEGPAIEIKKYTNGADADNANGNDVPKIAPNGGIVWTYVVSNTGNVPFAKADVVVTDNRGVAVSYEKVLVGDGDEVLEPGEIWQYKATGNALTLSFSGGPVYVVNGCQTGQGINRPTYNNVGTVSVTGTALTDNDPSHYCNPENPGIEIKKYTNGADADDANGNDVPKIAPNGGIEWTYVVSNTGNVPFNKASVVVTDNRGVAVSYEKVLVGDGDEVLEPGEIWQYKATGNALTLTANGAAYIVEGCKTAQDISRPTYNNTGTVSVTGTALTDSDPSHYCNPEGPGIQIKKYTNGADADDANGNDVPRIAPDGAIEWTYVVSNTGNVPFLKANIEVSDDRGVTPVFNSELAGNGDETLDPNERWLYKATGSAELLEYGPVYVVEGCSVGESVKRPTYNNTGMVAVEAGPSDTDASHYCNPFDPGIAIKKYTNGEDADTPTGPVVAVGSTVTWTYVVTNAGNVALANVVVTDNIAGVTPVYISGDVNGNSLLDLTETWLYRTTGIAVAGQYANIGTTKGTPPEGPEVTDDDPSHYFATDTTVAALGDRVWNDVNANGVQDEGEVGVPNVTVNLLGSDCSTSMNKSTTTNENGIYGFTNLVPGDYCVEFVLSTIPAGYKVSPQNVGDDAADSDGDLTTGKTQIVTLPGGVTNLTLDLGIFEPASLGDRVWNDVNLNGIQDEGEVGVPNVTVNLLAGDCLTPMNQSTTTNENGIYGFSNLTPGSYCVEFALNTLPVGFHVTPSNVGEDDAVDSDGDSSTGKTGSVTLPSGTQNLTLDLGIYELASLGDKVWHDLNANGVQDGGEPGVPDVTVTLLTNNCTDPTGMTTETDGSGIYSFPDLTPGTYCVQFTLPEGYHISPQNVGDDNFDSDGDLTTGKTQSVTLTGGSQNLTLDLGIYQLATLGNRVWVDANKNGTQDEGESNVQGVKVTLYNGNNQQVGEPTVTDENGEYLFVDLMPGTYYVIFDPTTLPAGYTFTTSNGGGITDDKDSDADVSGKTQAVTIKSADNYRDLDAGIVEIDLSLLAELGDTVWYDVNKDGIQDGLGTPTGEKGVPGVEVKLYTSGGGFVKSDTTDADGKYLFTELQPGSYYVEFASVNGYSYTHYNVNGNSQDADDSDPLVPWVDVTINDGGLEGELGQPLVYTIFYTNTDVTLAATNVVISTTIPTGTSFVAASSTAGWVCSNPAAGNVCTLTLPTLAANTSGTATFVVLLSTSEPAVPDQLDIFVDLTQGTLARTQVVPLAAGESNLTVDAGLVIIESSLTTPTPTEPTNLPGGEQPGNTLIFLPMVQH